MEDQPLPTVAEVDLVSTYAELAILYAEECYRLALLVEAYQEALDQELYT
jgi:hypothetical protein